MAESLEGICPKAGPIYSPQPVMVEKCSALWSREISVLPGMWLSSLSLVPKLH